MAHIRAEAHILDARAAVAQPCESQQSREATVVPHRLFTRKRQREAFVKRERREIGLPGVGKTHLATSLAITVAERGRRVYYATLADLILWLEEAQVAGHLPRRLRTLCRRA